MLAVAGCGSSSTPATASHTDTHMTMTHHTMKGHAMRGQMMSGHAMLMQKMEAVPHAQLTTASSHYGRVIYGADHLVLYAFSADHTSTSTCYGACAAAWPPLLTRGAPQVAGLNPALLGTTKRKNGSQQVTYGGHPLYYWSGDKPGTIMCQHVNLHGGFWYVLGTNGKPNMAKGVGTMSMK